MKQSYEKTAKSARKNNSEQTNRKHLLLLFGKKSNFKGVLAIVKNWGAFILCYFLIAWIMNLPASFLSVTAYIIISFFAGCTLRGFDNLTHEASHNNIFSKGKLHQKLQFLFSYVVFKTIENYRFWHFKHHRYYLNNKEEDPDTQQNIRLGVGTLTHKGKAYQIIWFYVIRFFLLYYFIYNIRYCFIPHIRSKSSIIGRIIFWGVIIFIVTITHSWLLFLLAYVIPCFIWLPYIRFITESSKHTNVNDNDDFGNSRSNIGLIHQLLLHPHNDGYHQMHHFLPAIPFYNLKKAYIYMTTDINVKNSVIESHSFIQTIKQIFKIK
jgi:fatty acid desaturase